MANVTTHYGYDSIYQLLSATQGGTTTESYSYDPVGNRLSSLGVPSYTVNSSNELTADSNASFTYDNNGNMTSKTDTTGTTSYTWDYENRMTSATLPNNGGSTSFKYDPFGRRIEKISPAATSIFAYDGDGLVETVNATGSTVARYTQGQNIDEPLAMQRGTTTNYYEQDGLGSVISLTAVNGTVAQSYAYDSFGNATGSSGSLTNFLRYTAREFDTEPNIYYSRARYYDPTAGRFLSEDTDQFDSGINFYSYVLNNPVAFNDPTGHNTATAPWPMTWGWGTTTGVGEAGSTLLGHLIGGAITAIGQLTLFAPSVARDEDMLRRPDCDEKKPDCQKATPYQLAAAGIEDAHEFKKEFLGNKAPISNFDICACKDGSIVIKARGQCGSPGPGIETGRT